MNVVHVLKGSFDLILRKPKIFLPNLFASLLYALAELVLIKVSIDIIGVIRESYMYLSLAELQPHLFVFLGVLLLFPIIGVIDLVTYSMYPAIVADYHERREISLRKALKDALSAWRVWLAFGLIFLFFAVFVLMLVVVFAALTLLSGDIMFLLIGAFLSVLLVLFFMLLIFFVMPVGVIEGVGILESFRESFRLGLRHSREVVFLNMFILVVVFASFAFGNLLGAEEMSVGLTFVAVALFLLVKLIQSMMYTYICVVNPYFYLGVARDGRWG